jgi:hypothetical protein
MVKNYYAAKLGLLCELIMLSLRCVSSDVRSVVTCNHLVYPQQLDPCQKYESQSTTFKFIYQLNARS